eukprot:scaffold650047_cov47-Prasinocladus_malaysianus.AAC.1
MTGASGTIVEVSEPDSQSLTHVMQHIESKNPPIYEDGFNKLKVWCRDVPDWVLSPGTSYEGTALLDVILKLAKDTSVNEGHRAGQACETVAALAQKMRPRECMKENPKVLPAIMAVLKAGKGVPSSAKLS